jgi:hypothetical protein
MSIITDALKLAASQEKTISKQENEIAVLKAKVESLTNAKAAADEEARIAKEALKAVNAVVKLELKEAKRVAKAELQVVQAELKVVKAELKVALKTTKVPKTTKSAVPENASPDEVKRKPGRQKKVVEQVLPEVDPRQIPIPDLGAPATTAQAQPEQKTTPGISAKGIDYEYV